MRSRWCIGSVTDSHGIPREAGGCMSEPASQGNPRASLGATSPDQEALVSGASLDERLRTLATMDIAALRTEWRRLYRVSPPPRLRRDLLTRGIADKWQADALGGLSGAIRRRLLALAEERQEEGEAARAQPAPRLRPGTRLLRTWRGRTMSVTVLEDGFLFEDRSYASLTKIAKAITGAHWSGPRFFGLAKVRPVIDGASTADGTVPDAR